LVFINSGVKIN